MEEIPSSCSIEIADAHMATDRACDLGIDEVRSLDEFNFGKPAGRFRTKKGSHDERRVGDNHRSERA